MTAIAEALMRAGYNRAKRPEPPFEEMRDREKTLKLLHETQRLLGSLISTLSSAHELRRNGYAAESHDKIAETLFDQIDERLEQISQMEGTR